jgi:hypothetical protein
MSRTSCIELVKVAIRSSKTITFAASTRSGASAPTFREGYADFRVSVSEGPAMDEAPISGSRSIGMLFDLCAVHPSLLCPGQCESRVDRPATPQNQLAVN